MRERTFTAILYWEEDVWVAECPEVGVASQGETMDEALAMLREATELYLEDTPMVSIPQRFVTSFTIGDAPRA
jgi:predicted RNase H-like HicB family nuclease